MGPLKKLSRFVLKTCSLFSKRQWAILFVFCFAYLFSACVSSLQAPFYPAEAERKGASETEIGFIFGIFQLVVFLVSGIFGKYMNKWGPKFVFNFGILTTAFSCVVFGFLDKVNGHIPFVVLSFIIRIFEAIGSSAFCCASFTIIANEFPLSIATTFASLETFYGLGLGLGPSIGGALFEVGGFILPFVVTGICLALVAIIAPTLMSLSMNANESDDCKEGFSVFSLLKIPAAAVSAISIWMSSNSVGFLNATLEPHLRHEFQFSGLQVGLIFMITALSYAISAPIFGKVMDKSLHPKYVSLFGCILLVISHLVIGPAVFIPSKTLLGLVVLGLVLHGVAVGAIQVSGFILALREAKENGFPDNLATYSVVSGLWTSALALGLFLGPSFGGVLLDYTNFRYASLYPFVTAIIVMCLLMGFIAFNIGNKSRIYTESNYSNNTDTETLLRCNNRMESSKAVNYGSAT